MTEFLQRDFAHQNFFDLCIHEKQRLRQALNLLSNLLLTKIQLCSGPNITGGITGFDYGDGSAWVYGAFSTDSVHAGSSTGYTTNVARVSFQAQRSSSLYGGSNGVQPSAIRVLSCIKT